MKRILVLAACAALAACGTTQSSSAGARSTAPDPFRVAFATSRSPFTVEVTRALAPHGADRHTRDLAQLFHRLYHEHPVLHAEDEATRALRRGVFRLFGATVTEILEELLGIPVPEEM